ncbi:MAG TPA: flagellar biosynthesis protein FlhF [Roseateles sp.]
MLRDEIRIPSPQSQRPVPQLSDIAAAEPMPLPGQPTASQRSQMDMASELRQMRGLIEERFSSLAFMEKLQRQPVQARLTQKLLELGFSPALVRKLAESCPSDFRGGEVADETAWAAHVLSRNLQTDETAPAIEDRGGVFALIGSTGVGKTTTTAKLAAHFATKYGASQLGLITLDAYRIGAHEQLRAYGRILGVPVHTAHDRASLDDLLDLLSSKKLVLIDTAGMAQRDSRTQELLEMLAHPSIKKLLVINAAQQGETIEDVVSAWKGAACEGVVLSKIDEAVKLAPALDTLIRHKLKVLGVANGQRVPEDWHRLPSVALVQRALKGAASGAWRMDNTDVNLIFAGAPLTEGMRAIH